MDKITKFLLKLSVKERSVLMVIMEKILSWNIKWFDEKKLKLEEYLYRIRKGKIRIIYYKKDNEIKIIDMNYRWQIYKK